MDANRKTSELVKLVGLRASSLCAEGAALFERSPPAAALFNRRLQVACNNQKHTLEALKFRIHSGISVGILIACNPLVNEFVDLKMVVQHFLC